MRKHGARALALFVLTSFPIAAVADDTAYRASVEKWRQEYEAQLKAEGGWLSVSGLFWLHEGNNTFGSAPTNDIVLPAAAPAEAGVFQFHAGKTVVRVKPGVALTQGGKLVTSAELRPDESEDQIALGDLKMYIHQSGQRFAVRLKDKNSALRKNFLGLRWYPIDPAYRVVAKWVPYDKPHVAQVQNIMGDIGTEEIPGYAEFSLRGQTVRLEGDVGDGEIEFVIRDLTSGHGTYGAARFVVGPAPSDGKVVIDFNEAYNPPCAYNPYTTCPLPFPGNRMKIAIEAGEKSYIGHAAH